MHFNILNKPSSPSFSVSGASLSPTITSNNRTMLGCAKLFNALISLVAALGN